MFVALQKTWKELWGWCFHNIIWGGGGSHSIKWILRSVFAEVMTLDVVGYVALDGSDGLEIS
jgi:hypothetical protein